ncbi:porphobilinogen deaminase isoform X3 [Anopheles sinensis]|uniref:Porphobilinogen deaminase isoform X3 n=1 Tax=Anopheles sinensis TaxID=74873 RepID=A0A084WGZ4_ANOSI|nr:porphobilinogen deaminase isoform X3 [Anopheles sinensis]
MQQQGMISHGIDAGIGGIDLGDGASKCPQAADEPVNRRKRCAIDQRSVERILRGPRLLLLLLLLPLFSLAAICKRIAPVDCALINYVNYGPLVKSLPQHMLERCWRDTTTTAAGASQITNTLDNRRQNNPVCDFPPASLALPCRDTDIVERQKRGFS